MMLLGIALMQALGTAVAPELVLLSEPVELLSESDEDESESEDEEESDELELSCLRLLRGAAAPCSLGWSSSRTSLGSMNLGRNCNIRYKPQGLWHDLQLTPWNGINKVPISTTYVTYYTSVV